MPGPVPNRESDLARPRERKGSDQVPVTKGVSRPTKVPHADPEWHPIARKFWDALKVSGQVDFYEQSDWAYAYSLMDDLSHYKSSTRRSSQMLAAIDGAMSKLLVTEADRRRVRVELHDHDDGVTDVEDEAIADYAAELGVVVPIRG